MNYAALKTFGALIPVCAVFAGSAIIWLRRKNMSSSLQLLGAAAFVMVVLAHLFEALRIFPQLGWGSKDSVGHYLDLVCAILGLTLFSLGYLIHAVNMPTEKRE